MDTTANVLLLHAELAWCDVCAAEQLLMPTDDASGLCCTVCDAAVFVVLEPALDTALDTGFDELERRSA